MEALPYHRAMADLLEAREPGVWSWFASAEARADYADEVRLDLLKSAYRLERDTHPEVYEAVDHAAASLGVEDPVTVYQCEGHGGQLNASLHHLPREAHVVLQGPVLDSLTPDERRALFGHELAHHRLYDLDGGRYHLAARLLHTAALDPRAEGCHVESARRYQLFTEVFADRGAVRASGAGSAISCLIKIGTGSKSVNPSDYLRQAREILAKDARASEGFSHPETYLRAHALDLWAREGAAAEAAVARLISGRQHLSEFDLLDQVHYTLATRRLLQLLLQPPWFRTDAVLALARQYLHDFEPDGETDWTAFLAETDLEGKAVRDYFSFVLLDFALVDPDLGDPALTACLEAAAACGLEDTFAEHAYELGKVKKKDLARLRPGAARA